jgi:hypothetical protein
MLRKMLDNQAQTAQNIGGAKEQACPPSPIIGGGGQLPTLPPPLSLRLWHHYLNDMVRRAMTSAGISAVKEPHDNCDSMPGTLGMLFGMYPCQSKTP